MPAKDTLDALNTRYYALYPQTGFRLYGCRDADIDLTPLQDLTNAAKISVESDQNVGNPGVFARLPNLKSLRLSVYLLKDFSFVKDLPPGLEQLALETKSTAFDLAQLEHFRALKVLNLHGYKKNIDALGNLPMLESLMLRGISPPSYAFINRIQNLKALKIQRGNNHDFAELYGNAAITALQLFRITHLANVELIAHLPNLQSLELCQLRHVTALPDLSGHTHLRDIYLDDMKGLTDLGPLEHAPNLASVSYSMCPAAFMPQDILPVLRNPGVSQCSFYASGAKNPQISELIAESGKQNACNFMMVRNALFSNCTEF